MFSNIITYYKYERAGERLICLRVQKRFDETTSKWWVNCVTEVPMPPLSAENVLPADWPGSARQFNTRLQLQLNTLVATDATAATDCRQPALQAARDAPHFAPTLRLDEKAWNCHSADFAWWMGGGEDTCDNPWVAELYPDASDEELKENEGGRR